MSCSYMYLCVSSPRHTAVGEDWRRSRGGGVKEEEEEEEEQRRNKGGGGGGGKVEERRTIPASLSLLINIHIV